MSPAPTSFGGGSPSVQHGLQRELRANAVRQRISADANVGTSKRSSHPSPSRPSSAARRQRDQANRVNAVRARAVRSNAARAREADRLAAARTRLFQQPTRLSQLLSKRKGSD